MGRLLLAGAVIVLALGPVHAGPMRKVLVESEPPGASVYLDDVDKGVACEPTPCEVNAPVGTVMLIIRMDKFEPEIQEVDVPKGKRPLQQRVKLKSAIGTIRVDAPKGASVQVDEVDKGKAPVEISASAGDPHHVVVKANGKTVFDDIVEVATGDEYVVKPKMASTPVVADTAIVTEDDDDGNGDDDTDGDGVGSAGITGSTAPKPRSAFITGGIAFDVGIRHVTYTAPPMQEYVRELEGGSQALLGPAVEVWPGRMLGVHALRGLSLFGRAQFSVVAQTVGGNDLDAAVTSKWSSFEASLRQRWQFSSFVVEASGGYVKDSFAFTATMDDLDKMPIADYQSLRLGGRLGFVSDSVEPYISGENRIVFAAGELATRFDSSSASGLRGAVGVIMRFGMVTARAEGTYTSYSWDLTPGDPKWQATAASDSIMMFSTVVGLSY